MARTHLFDTKEEAHDYLATAMIAAFIAMDINIKDHAEEVRQLMNNIKCFSGEMTKLTQEGKADPYEPEPYKEGATLDESREKIKEQVEKIKKDLGIEPVKFGEAGA